MGRPGGCATGAGRAPSAAANETAPIRTARERRLVHVGRGPDAGGGTFIDESEVVQFLTAGMLFAQGAILHDSADGEAELDALVARIAADELRIRGKASRHAQLQHYATPIRIGWAMALAAGIEENDVVLDPSAGTGTLLALAHLACPGATLHAHEAAAIRTATLRATAPQVMVKNGDATTLATEHPVWRNAHDIIVMNPPASARIDDPKKHRNEDLRHLRAFRPGTAQTGPGVGGRVGGRGRSRPDLCPSGGRYPGRSSGPGPRRTGR